MTHAGKEPFPYFPGEETEQVGEILGMCEVWYTYWTAQPGEYQALQTSSATTGPAPRPALIPVFPISVSVTT